MASGPLNIRRLPDMWPRTKPARTRPERAMTTFFPIEAGRQQEQQELADIRREVGTDRVPKAKAIK